MRSRDLSSFCTRNALLQQMGAIPPKAVKTGTTIAGIVFKDGVLLGADTRATEVTILLTAVSSCALFSFTREQLLLIRIVPRSTILLKISSKMNCIHSI